MVYVISKNGEPLMPCANVIARLLLKQGKAKVKRLSRAAMHSTSASSLRVMV